MNNKNSLEPRTVSSTTVMGSMEKAFSYLSLPSVEGLSALPASTTTKLRTMTTELSWCSPVPSPGALASSARRSLPFQALSSTWVSKSLRTTKAWPQPHHGPGDPFSPILLFLTSLCSPPAATGGPPKSGNTSFRFSDCISHPKRASLKPGTHPTAAWGDYSQTPWLCLPSLQAQLQGGTRTHKTPSQKQMNEQVNKINVACAQI